MKDENIKERIKYFKHYVVDNLSLDAQDDFQKILDYITNLQQAIEVKNERIKEEQQEKERYIKFYNELNIWNKELQQENERLKEENKHIFANVNDDELLISNAMNYAEAQDYKSRCEKASEYINNNREEEYVTGKPMLSYWAIDNLLNILQNGSDKNA